MNPAEAKIVRSFKNLKTDIIKLQNRLAELSKSQDELLKNLTSGEQKKGFKTSRKKIFVASKKGRRFHIPECPFAQNIKPKSKITFKTKDSALNQGYKPDSCIK
mgnify:CR=1 FL=1